MTADSQDDAALDAELAALRGALRELRAPDEGDAALLAAYRGRLAARVPARPPPAVATRPRAWLARRPFGLAVAATLVVAVAALVAVRVERAERDGRASGAGAATAAREAPSPTGVFRPLGFPRGVSAAESYSVVRVRIQLATFVANAGAPPDAAIEADVLVGEDGLARAIRFDSADTLFMTTVAKESGEGR